MAKMFAVMRTSYTPCDCGSRDNRSVHFVTADETFANDFVKEQNDRTSAWSPEFEVEEVKVR